VPKKKETRPASSKKSGSKKRRKGLKWKDLTGKGLIMTGKNRSGFKDDKLGSWKNKLNDSSEKRHPGNSRKFDGKKSKPKKLYEKLNSLKLKLARRQKRSFHSTGRET